MAQKVLKSGALAIGGVATLATFRAAPVISSAV
jgi:hypothetical protein